MRRMEQDGTVEEAQGRPVAEDHSTGQWYELAPAIEGLSDFHEIAGKRRGIDIDVSALRKFSVKLSHASPIMQPDLDAVRACAKRCKALAMTMTVDEAESVLQTVRIDIALGGDR